MSDDTQTGSLEERKAELFATMTLIKAAKRDLALVQSRGGDQLPLIDRLADLESDRERLAHEVNGQYMYRNLQSFMSRVDAYDALRVQESLSLSKGIVGLRTDVQELAAETATRLGKIESDHAALAGIVSDLGEEQSQFKTDIGTLKDDMGAFKIELGEVKTRVGQIEVVVQRLAEESGATKATREMIRRWKRNNPPPPEDGRA